MFKNYWVRQTENDYIISYQHSDGKVYQATTPKKTFDYLEEKSDKSIVQEWVRLCTEKVIENNSEQKEVKEAPTLFTNMRERKGDRIEYRECRKCGKVADKSNWQGFKKVQEGSSRIGKQNLKKREKGWRNIVKYECSGCYFVDPPRNVNNLGVKNNPILQKNLKFLSNNSLPRVVSQIDQNSHDVWNTKKGLSQYTNLFQNFQNQTNQNTQNTKENKQQIRQLEARNTALEENQTKLWGKVFPAKKIPQTIYDFTNWKYYVGWPIFLIFTGCVIKKVYRTKTRKRKESKNYLVEIHRIFQEWQLNMYASTGGYVVGFYLIKEAIEKWINPRISNWLVTQKLITLSVVCLIIGIGFYVDGIITSSLKTPLQRLAIRIENANIDEKTKRSLLSKTQQVNELFKETLKRFGLLAVVGILTKLIEIYWNKDILSYLSYAVPIAGAVKIIWEVDKTLKRLKLNGSKK